MQLSELFDHEFVDLQMSAFPASFFVHHAHEVAVPIGHLFFLCVGIGEVSDIFFTDAAQRAVVCADEVFYLPHIQQVFGNAFFS